MPEQQHLKDNIIIRKVLEKDLDAIMELEVVAFTMPWSRKSYEDMMKVSNVNFETAVCGDKVLSYMLYQYWSEGAELHTLAVNPNWRRKGVARKMLTHLFDWAREHGVEKIFLQVRPSNSKALDLYKSFGFVAIGTRKKYYTDNNEDAYIMVAKVK